MRKHIYWLGKALLQSYLNKKFRTLGMLLKELVAYMESWAPLDLQESYDNSGLLLGSGEEKVEKALLSLDCTEGVVEEAIRERADLIICHHPPIFAPLKRLNGSNASERIVLKAIENRIALYAAHTNLDNAPKGVSFYIAEKLGLTEINVLDPLKGKSKKMVVFCPRSHADAIREALFVAGAGAMEGYAECSFSARGNGTFKALEGSKPFLGGQGSRHTEAEERIECIYPLWLESALVQALKEVHPYEVPAFDLISLDNELASYGAGVSGFLPEPLACSEFLDLINQRLKAEMIRHTAFDRPIKKVACCGGSGSFLLSHAMRQACDAFVTADFKYHQFFDAERRLMIADIGHFESEQFTPELLHTVLSRKFPNFALQLSKEQTNPIQYYYGNNC